MVDRVLSEQESATDLTTDNVLSGWDGHKHLLGSSEPLKLSWPGAGQTAVFAPIPGQALDFRVDFGRPDLEVMQFDDHLMLRSDDGIIVVKGAMDMLTELPPPITLEGGVAVTVDELLALWGVDSLDDIETAGGAADNTGAAFRTAPVEALPDGLDSLAPLDGTELTYDSILDDAANQPSADTTLLAVRDQLAAAEAQAQPAPAPEEDDEEPEEPDNGDGDGDGGVVAVQALGGAPVGGDDGDPLDVADLLVGFDPGEEADYVSIAFDDGDTVVSVDYDGTGNGFDFVELATLPGMVSFDDVIAQMQLTNDV